MTRFKGVAAMVAGVAIVASTQASADSAAAAPLRGWASAGIGAARQDFGSAAPSLTGAVLSVEAGWLFTPHWGLGMEIAVDLDQAACTFCGADGGYLRSQFANVFVVAEYRPRDFGWRFHARAGLSTYDLAPCSCAGYPGYEVDAFGVGLSAGYQWRLPTVKPLSLGVRLSGQSAHFPARPNKGIESFPYSELTLTAQLSFN